MYCMMNDPLLCHESKSKYGRAPLLDATGLVQQSVGCSSWD